MDEEVRFSNDEWPSLPGKVAQTAAGTPYLTEPGVALIAQTKVDFGAIYDEFLPGFDDELDFENYSADSYEDVSAGDALAKVAGQNCYLSFGPNRTKNSEIGRYLENIKSSGHGCYDEKTEVLTSLGWKFWRDTTFEDSLATLNLATQAIEYQKPTGLIQAPFQGKMFSINSKQLDLCVTPNHRLLVLPQKETNAQKLQVDAKLLEADSIGQQHHGHLKTGGIWNGLEVDEALAELLGFFIGDGFCDVETGSQRIHFNLKKVRKINFLIERLSVLGWSFKRNDYEHSTQIKAIVPDKSLMNDLFKNCYEEGEKRIPPELLITWGRRSLGGILHGLLKSDGTISDGKRGGKKRFYTSSKYLSGQIQQLCLHAGMFANAVVQHREESDFFWFNVQKNAVSHVNDPHKFAMARSEWTMYAGTVYCAEVPNGTLYVRRNGKPVWCGNSVLEHANYSFLIYGGDRSFSHELVRHRAGAAYSQVSQRYVDGKVLRFVEREEFQNDPLLHQMFETWIDKSAAEYEDRARRLMESQKTGGILTAETKRDMRKKVNQAARACLPNETEAPIIMTGNARAFRHVLEMRASEHADVQIRKIAMKIYRCLAQVAPNIFSDYALKELSDGTLAIETKWRKV